MNDFKPEEKRTFFLILFVLLVLGLVLLAKMFFEGIVYFFFTATGTIVMFAFPAITKLFNKHGSISKAYLGISRRWFLGILLGIFAGLFFIVLTKIKVFGGVAQLITPSVPLALSGQFTVVTILAPICETLFFTMSLLSILLLFMPAWLAVLIKSLAFSGYHFWSYVIYSGNTINSALGSFVGAFLYGVMGSLLAYFWGAEADIASHVVFNGNTFNSIYHLFSVTG